LRIDVPVWGIAVVGLIVVAMGIILWSVKRRSHLHLHLEQSENMHEILHSIAGLTQSTVVAGNSVSLLLDGAFFDALYADLGKAKTSIHFETFLSKDGEVTRKVAALLSEKARSGVSVRLMLDGSGGKDFGKKAVKEMCDAGVHVCHYHPFNLKNLGKINNRTHRKIVVIDGRIGYVGGHCLVDTWLGHAEDKKHFRDISARVEGPVVSQLQSAFVDNWIEETGAIFGGDEYFPVIEPCGKTSGHVVWVSPTGAPSTMKILYYMAIRSAKERLTIQNPYFLPDPDARKGLLDAVKRGVDVRIMLPSDTASDSPFVQHASHHHFGTLLKGGVKMYEYERTLLHQKVITVDGCWSAVGSTNFDDRSFEINDEVALVIHGPEMAEQLEAIFEKDLKHARERKLDEWIKRPWLHKLRDGGSFLFNEQL
jgi:cardiolipin synthase A/B